jgi:2-dehydro-3-deoxyphosphogluconate aldolase / (4S)-4-hydroxy-2-oxoglutarate aldolase
MQCLCSSENRKLETLNDFTRRDKSMAATKLMDKISQTGVIAVLVVDRSEDAVPLAKALLEGGIDVAELTLRTPASLDVLRAMISEVKEMVVGAGTILSVEQVQQVAEAGAAFGVAPGMNPRVVYAAQAVGLPFMPGVLTPSDVEQALECGCKELKFFPAESIGGLAYLKNMAAPYAHRNVRFIPLGGLSLANARSYLEDPRILAIGGSWIAKRELIERRDWKTITQNAREICELVSDIRKTPNL